MDETSPRPEIDVEQMPAMEWMLEELVADDELRYIPRNDAKLDELPKAYDVADGVSDDRRVELIAMLRRYHERRRGRDARS